MFPPRSGGTRACLVLPAFGLGSRSFMCSCVLNVRDMSLVFGPFKSFFRSLFLSQLKLSFFLKLAPARGIGIESLAPE